jgi:hypothetical protein
MAQAEGVLQRALIQLVRAVTAGDLSAASRMLADEPRLATAASGEGASRASAKPFYLDEIGHYLYAGDTALHIAAAGYRQKIARKLVASGADVRARNRRGAEPLHYAADGAPGAHTWNPRTFAPRGAHAMRRGRTRAAGERRGCEAPQQERFDPDAARHQGHRPRRLRVAGGEGAAGRNHWLASGAWRWPIAVARASAGL